MRAHPSGAPSPRYLYTASSDSSSGSRGSAAGNSRGISGTSGTAGSAGGSGCSTSAQALGGHTGQGVGEGGSCDTDEGHTPSSPGLEAYHRSSGGMRLMRVFSSSTASREISVGGRGRA